MSILSKLFGDPTAKLLGKYKKRVEEINALEDGLVNLSDEKLRVKSDALKKRVANGISHIAETDKDKRKREIDKILDEVLPEAFALVREAAKRTLGQRHYDVQLLGGMVLNSGRIAEMRTGEGKTLVATLPAYLNALTGLGVHVVTVNDYLAKRDAKWMGNVYDFLGMSVGIIQQEGKSFVFEKSGEIDLYGESNLRPSNKKDAYDCDITYGTNNELGFDYLRDNMVADISQMAMRHELYFAIVDEVDSILIDEARTPLIISAPAEESGELYRRFAQIVPNLKKEEDYTVDEKLRAVSITNSGIDKVEKALGINDIYSGGRTDMVHALEQALKAHALFTREKDYVVMEDEVIIVDEFTGRMLQGRRYSGGLHQAIEAKENVQIKRESVTLATITFQNYFRLYEKLAGMTGTALTQAEEFGKVYNLDVAPIPTNRENIRTDLADQIYKTEDGKFEAVALKIKELNDEGVPVLIGTVSIEKNEKLSRILKKHKVPHNVLNAKNHEQEAQIIENAGRVGAVTVATNMAGRGVDIILGGVLGVNDQKDEKKIKTWEKEHEKVLELGGLHVIGTERHESRRVDNQLRGRAGRQGDPGVTQFFVSLEDDLMRIFGSEKIKMIMDRLGLPEDQAIEHKMISGALENAQKKVEGHNFDMRKHLLEYDDVLNKHREVIYKLRREALSNQNLSERILSIFADELRGIAQSAFATIDDNEPNLIQAFNEANAIIPIDEAEKQKILAIKNADDLSELLVKKAEKLYEARQKELDKEVLAGMEKAVFLRAIDTLWIEHLEAMESLKEGIGLRGYGQKDPLVEYKQEGYNMFQRLLGEIEHSVAITFFHVSVESRAESSDLRVENKEDMPDNENQNPAIITKAPEIAPQNEGKKSISQFSTLGSQISTATAITRGREQNAGDLQVKKEKIGRNDPCWCGSGRKFKKCHGR